MRIATIVGARPQFVKAAPVSRAIRRIHSEFLIHTGQHYDDNMSAVFFRELGIPDPEFTLGIGSGQHGAQTGAMLGAIERVLIAERPDLVLVYGDTNSTLAGALAASKLHIPVAHVEAGLRSFNRRMPEEINRVMADHLSSLLFTPSASSADQLRQEGIEKGVFVVGDVMLDVVRESISASDGAEILRRLSLAGRRFFLATLHRAETTDHPTRLQRAIDALATLDAPVVFPMHPRTAARIASASVAIPPNIVTLPPVGYHDMLQLTKHADAVITDSGGLQKEAYFLGTPCVTVRTETEWRETVALGWNVLCDPDEGDLRQSLTRAHEALGSPRPEIYGDGNASQRIVERLIVG